MNIASGFMKRDVFTNESASDVFRKIDLNRIDDVVDNPRYISDNTVFNENYDDIRESIANTGGQYLVLDVCEKEGMPGFYSIFKGGSTRLRIARELSELAIAEGIPNNYEKIRCVVYPTVGDSERLILTATENLTRGDLCYGEKARAVQYMISGYNLQRNEGTFVIEEFLEFLERSGAKQLVPNRREYYVLTDCHNLLLSRNVFNKKIINGRANREFIRDTLTLRSRFIEDCVERGVSDGEVVFERLCENVDSEVVTVKDLKSAISGYWASGAEPKTYANDFDEHFEIGLDSSIEKELGDDDSRNAVLFVSELIRNRKYESSRKKTFTLKKMGVTNDLAGTFQLLDLLTKKGRTLAVKELKKGPSAAAGPIQAESAMMPPR